MWIPDYKRHVTWAFLGNTPSKFGDSLLSDFHVVKSQILRPRWEGFLVLKMSASDPGFQAALEEARQGAKEGGIPIGACLVDKDGNILGRGHNMRLQKGSAILHVRNRLSHKLNDTFSSDFILPLQDTTSSVIIESTDLCFVSCPRLTFIKGRDGSSRIRWSPSRFGVQGKYDVYDTLSLLHVHRRLSALRDSSCSSG